MKVRTRVALLLATAAASGLFVVSAYAADYPWIPLDRTRPSCEPCHWETDPNRWPLGDETLRKYGPHGYYFSTTNRCVFCHTAHEAEERVIFQESSPTAVRDTISELCFVCHDSTGKMGVYSQLAAFGYSVGASHTCDVSVAIPGGYGGLTLTCTSCHTPHNNSRVAGNWMSFSPRQSQSAASAKGNTLYMTNRLLRDNLRNTPRGTYSVYGGRWCAGCHQRRHAGIPGINNHPVDTQTAYQAYTVNPADAPQLGIFIFDPTAPNAYEANGRVSPRPALGPRCQQCHENTMDVEGQLTWRYGNYSLPPATRTVDPDGPGPQPARAIGDSFPHQTQGANLLVETGDDLCLNCHSTISLP